VACDLVELVAEGGECLGPARGGERVEQDEQFAVAGDDVTGGDEVQRLSGPADRRRLPLLEDEDLTGEAVIEPSRLIRPVDAPAVAVACFFRDVVEELSGRQDARPVCRLHSEMGPASLWEIEHRGVRLGVFHPGVGAPLAGAMLEQVIARGVRGVIACGTAGALVPELVMGHAVILTGAVRDEGTSFHYLPAGRVVSADPGPAESLADALSAAAWTQRTA
jgi:uridine phosphorylase